MLSGKQFNKVIWCLKVALESLLLDVFVEEMFESAQGDQVFDIVISLIGLILLLSSVNIHSFIHSFNPL